MDQKPRLPDNEVVVTQTVSEDFPASPNRYLYAANGTPSPTELEWEHVWDVLTNCDYDSDSTYKGRHSPYKGRHSSYKGSLSPYAEQFTSDSDRSLSSEELKKVLKSRKVERPSTPVKNRSRDSRSSGYYSSDGESTCFRWKHQDDFEWSRERITCLGRGIVDLHYQQQQPSQSMVWKL